MCSQLGCQEAAEVAAEAAVEEEEVEEVRSWYALLYELRTSEGHVRHMGC